MPPKQLPTTRVLAILGLGLCLSLLGDSTLYTVLPDPTIAGQAGLSMAMVGLVLGLNRLVRIVSNLPAGWLFDRMPRRGLMVASAGLGTLSTICYAAGQGTGVFLLGRVLWGLAWSGIWVGCNTAVLDLASDSDRGTLTGKLNMWFYLGIALSSFAGGLFTDLFSFRGGLWISAALGGVGFLTWLVFLPETRRRAVHTELSQHKAGEDGRSVTSEIKAVVEIPPAAVGVPLLQPQTLSGGIRKNGLPLRLVLEAAGPFFVQRLVFSGVLSATAILWLAAYFGEGIRAGGLAVPLATLSGSYAGGRVLVSLVAAPLSGALADKARSRWSVLAACLGIGALGLWAMGRPQIGLALLGALLASISAGGIPGLMAALIGDQVHSSRHSRSLGIAFSVGDLGSAIGPSIGLGLVPLLGLGGTYLICAGIYVVAAVYALVKSWK